MAIVAIILIIVFATKKSDDDSKPGPGPGPGPTPPTPDGFNPYYEDPDPNSQVVTVSSRKGVLLFNTSFPTMEQLKETKKGFMVEDDEVAGIDSHNVANSRGVNNNFLERV